MIRDDPTNLDKRLVVTLMKPIGQYSPGDDGTMTLVMAIPKRKGCVSRLH